jgi:ABC-2 type transport system ATP-binding protein
MERHPMKILVRCDRPGRLAARAFEEDGVVEARLVEDGQGVLVATRDADSFYLMLNRVVLEEGLAVETVLPVDEDVQSVYRYLISADGGGAT